ncbi:MAG: PQQ-binding-like beta-propeller repeat protein [Bacteroidales bacterium]|nr:PQQ-binding-like beta-propeller repeat protein [Bacteroidales bacterium]
MQKIIYLLALVLLSGAMFVSCDKDENENDIEVEIEKSNPVVNSNEIIGNKLKLTWSHDTEVEGMQYSLKLNDSIYENPYKTFTKELEYDTRYEVEIIALYPNEEATSANINFTTPKSNILFFSTWAGTLYAIDLYSKEVIWQQDGVNSGYNTPHLIHNNQLISPLHNIRAFDIYTGEVNWTIQPYSNFNSGWTSVLEGDILYIGEYNQDKTIAIDISTQETLWQSYSEGDHIVIGDNIYVTNGFSAPDLIAIDKETGINLWSFNLDPESTSAAPNISSQPVLYENSLFFGDNIGRIYSVNATNGVKNWSKDMGLFEESSGAPVIYNDNLIIPIENKVYSINISTADINWINSSIPGIIYSSPFIYENKLILSSYDNGSSYVFVIDSDSGNLIWKKEFEGGIRSSPIVYDETIFIGSWNKEFYAIDLTDGEIIWQRTTDERISNSAVIVIGAGEKIIYPNNCGMI